MRALNLILSAVLWASILSPPAFAGPPESEIWTLRKRAARAERAAEREAERAARAERSSKPERRSKLQELAHRITELETANADLERLLERYRKGLERAVTELGRLRLEKLRGVESSSPRPPAAPPTPATVPTTPQERALVGDVVESGRRILSSPEVHSRNGSVVVRGEIYNPRREHLRGELIIELLRDGLPFDELRVPFELPANERRSYAESFVIEGYAAGTYTARAGLVY